MCCESNVRWMEGGKKRTYTRFQHSMTSRKETGWEVRKTFPASVWRYDWPFNTWTRHVDVTFFRLDCVFHFFLSIRILFFSGHRNVHRHASIGNVYNIYIFSGNLLRCTAFLIFAKSVVRIQRRLQNYPMSRRFLVKRWTDTDGYMYSICVCCQSFVRRVRQSRLKITLLFSEWRTCYVNCVYAFGCAAARSTRKTLFMAQQWQPTANKILNEMYEDYLYAVLYCALTVRSLAKQWCGVCGTDVKFISE